MNSYRFQPPKLQKLEILSFSLFLYTYNGVIPVDLGKKEKQTFSKNLRKIWWNQIIVVLPKSEMTYEMADKLSWLERRIHNPEVGM